MKLKFLCIFILFIIILYKKKINKEFFDNKKPLLNVKVPIDEKWTDVNTGQCSYPGNHFIDRENENINGKLAFLFMINDNLEWYELWNEYFKNIDQNKYKIIIHRSNPSKKLNNLNFPNIIVNTVESSWCYLVGVIKRLFEEAYKDNQIKGCILVSNHCVPVKNFNYIYNLYLSQNKSILRFSNPEFTKASLWGYFNRNLIKSYIDLPRDKSQINNNNFIGCEEEVFLGRLIRNYKLNVSHGVVNFDCWDKSTFDFLENDNLDKFSPLQFNKLNIKILNYLNNSQVCFMRKVNFNEFNFTLVYNNIFNI